VVRHVAPALRRHAAAAEDVVEEGLDVRHPLRPSEGDQEERVVGENAAHAAVRPVAVHRRAAGAAPLEA
jgi:hypothetical protein